MAVSAVTLKIPTRTQIRDETVTVHRHDTFSVKRLQHVFHAQNVDDACKMGWLDRSKDTLTSMANWIANKLRFTNQPTKKERLKDLYLALHSPDNQSNIPSLPRILDKFITFARMRDLVTNPADKDEFKVVTKRKNAQNINYIFEIGGTDVYNHNRFMAQNRQLPLEPDTAHSTHQTLVSFLSRSNLHVVEIDKDGQAKVDVNNYLVYTITATADEVIKKLTPVPSLASRALTAFSGTWLGSKVTWLASSALQTVGWMAPAPVVAPTPTEIEKKFRAMPPRLSPRSTRSEKFNVLQNALNNAKEVSQLMEAIVNYVADAAQTGDEFTRELAKNSLKCIPLEKQIDIEKLSLKTQFYNRKIYADEGEDICKTVKRHMLEIDGDKLCENPQSLELLDALFLFNQKCCTMSLKKATRLFRDLIKYYEKFIEFFKDFLAKFPDKIN